MKDEAPGPDGPPDIPSGPGGPAVNSRALMAYQKAKDRAADPDPSVRAELAVQVDVRPELLYYLADDDAPEVRRAVAANDATPLRAVARLARDPDPQVKEFLAARLGRALPGLLPAEQAALRDLAVHALEMLAADQLARVRAAVASAIADIDCAPPRIAVTLARDVAREVAEPVLRLCAGLSDEALLDLLASRAGEGWVAEAIAARRAVSRPVAEAVLRGGDAAAAASLLNNPGASLPPLGTPGLPPDFARRLSSFVDETVRWALRRDGGLDARASEEISDAVSRRLDWARDYVRKEQPEMRAARLYDAGRLTEEAVWDALSWGDRAFVQAALALLARIPPEIVRKMLDSGSPRAVTALAWRAGLSMRGARQLQARGAGIPPRKLLNARHGVDYPLTETELLWQLEFFGIADS
ncbi:MAG TPA: DUF2336 domain-containing protein [Azospirillaceae bacterium]|nr:DUF2336 domain-containing protein [Azospirillaceae bacterium]